MQADDTSPKRRNALLGGLLALCLAAGVGGYALGVRGGADLDDARVAGAQDGRRDGRREGNLSGYAEGYQRGWLTGVRKAYGPAYRDAYRDEFERAGVDPPAEIEVP